MLGKLLIQCEMEVQTGMHIGGGNVFSAIGAVDKTVVRDPVTGMPMVPGSSLKGKIRALLAKKTAAGFEPVDIKAEPDQMKRLFGMAQENGSKFGPAQLQFSDAFMIQKGNKEMTSPTEVKFENGIDRLTAVANPRQIERVVRGTKFNVRITYDVGDTKEAAEDMALLADGMILLALDYLGGHGSRGYGRVRFTHVTVAQKAGALSDENMKAIEEKLKKVEAYDVFS